MVDVDKFPHLLCGFAIGSFSRLKSPHSLELAYLFPPLRGPVYVSCVRSRLPGSRKGSRGHLNLLLKSKTEVEKFSAHRLRVQPPTREAHAGSQRGRPRRGIAGRFPAECELVRAHHEPSGDTSARLIESRQRTTNLHRARRWWRHQT